MSDPQASEQRSASPNTTLTEAPQRTGALDAILEQSSDPTLKEKINDFLDLVAKVGPKVDKNLSHTVDQAIDSIDAMVSRQLSEIMHAPEFQKLEGSWRGLSHLVFNTQTSKTLKIRVMQLTKEELSEDMASATNFDQSVLWKKLVDEELCMPGGNPYGVLIGDYEWNNHPEEIAALKGVMGV
ncbi:MAG: type VI secretion system contractile sheath domain-containing protein, partial [Planctomycetota bacterium]